jgi:Flp pilus assembly protein TadG
MRARLMRAMLLRRGSARRFRRHEGGLAAVEFALVLPIMVALWLAGVELTQGLSVDRHLNNLNSAIGDLVARTKQLKYSDVDAIFSLSTGAMFPYSASGVQMRVSTVNIDGNGNAKVGWSRGSGITARPGNQSLNTIVPQALRVANTQIIMSEVYKTYRPAVGYVITGGVDLDDRMFFVPRLSATVKLCDNNGANCS